MNKKIFVSSIALLLILFAVSSSALALQLGDRNISLNNRGQDVRQLQQELANLSYNVGPIDGIFGAITRRAVIDFQRDNNVPTTGLFGPLSFAALQRVTGSTSNTYVVKRGDMLWSIAQRHNVTLQALANANNITNPNVIFVGQVLTIPTGTNNSAPPTQVGGASMTPWTQVNSIFARGQNATVIDVQTGLSFTVRRLGGSNHADVEPLTVSDRNTMFRIYGNQWSWARRPIVVVVNGERIAASMNGMPHGGQNITNNNFNGHFCIHFLHSRTHGSNSLDSAHQNAVRQAVGK